MITTYAKSIVYIALAAMSFLIVALTDDRLDTSELINLAIVILGAIGVYLVPNLSKGVGAYSKGIIAFVTAGLVALLSFLSGGVTTAEWLQVGVAALAGIGVVIIPNEKPVLQEVAHE